MYSWTYCRLSPGSVVILNSFAAADYCILVYDMFACSLHLKPFFLTLKHNSDTFDRGIGSSVINKTLSLDTFANKSKSLKRRVQYCRMFRPSTLLRSPPKIQCLPGLLKTNGWKQVYSSLTTDNEHYINIQMFYWRVWLSGDDETSFRC